MRVTTCTGGEGYASHASQRLLAILFFSWEGQARKLEYVKVRLILVTATLFSAIMVSAPRTRVHASRLETTAQLMTA